MNVKLVGVGGIGTALLPPLARYLEYRAGPRVRVTLVDGDDFQSENRSRQDFQAPGNKAVIKAEELSRSFSNVSFRAIPEFVSPQNVNRIIESGDVVLLAVDNHSTRRLVSDRCRMLPAIDLISGGNELTDGNVQIYSRRNGEDRSKPLTYAHPEIQEPADLLPTDEGCERLMQTSEPQLLFTNLAVGSAMLGALYSLVELGEVPFDELYLDLPTGRHHPVQR